MSAIDKVNFDIMNGTLYNTYKVVGLAEPYEHKLGVTLECTLCHKQIRYRYTNLLNNISIPVCTCVGGRTKNDYQSLLGKIYQGWQITNIIEPNETNSNKMYEITCIHCKRVEYRIAKFIYKRIVNGQNISTCSCIQDRRLQQKEEIKTREREKVFLDKYTGIIGETVGDYKVVGLDAKTNEAILECQTCKRINRCQASYAASGNLRKITKCECIASGYREYSKYIGCIINNDRIDGYEYKKNGKGYLRWFNVTCLKCNKVRKVYLVSRMIMAVKEGFNSSTTYYEQCLCRKGTRDPNIIDRYTCYIGKHIENSKLTITDIWIDDSKDIIAHAICECGNEINTKLHSILHGHTKSCGCLLLESMYNNSRYTKHEYIGKIIRGRLRVKEIKQTETGGILWSCECLMCHKIADINPKLVVERNWHIDCGCMEPEARLRNQKYTSQELIGQNFGGGKILEIIKTPNGVTKWRMSCPFCGKEYTAIAANVASGTTSSCGCLGRSKGEWLVKDILDSHGIEYKQQVNLCNIRNEYGYKLWFDFIVSKNGKIYAIEFDGLQHDFESNHNLFSGGVIDTDRFERLQSNDRTKDAFCSKFSIPLLRIKQYQLGHDRSKIEKAILNFLNQGE